MNKKIVELLNRTNRQSDDRSEGRTLEQILLADGRRRTEKTGWDPRTNAIKHAIEKCPEHDERLIRRLKSGKNFFCPISGCDYTWPPLKPRAAKESKYTHERTVECIITSIETGKEMPSIVPLSTFQKLQNSKILKVEVVS